MTDGRLPAVNGCRLHTDNVVAMWKALAEDHGNVVLCTPRASVIDPSPFHALRAIVLDPGRDPGLTIREIAGALGRSPSARPRVVEDAAGALDLRSAGFTPYLTMTVMVRDAGVLSDGPGRPETVEIVEVDSPRTLATAERVLTTVFPPARSDSDWVGTDWAGQIQPVRVLDLPGWRVWLGCREGVPACAAFTYHDGRSVGLYQVGTLAEHRGHGAARALVEAILRGYPDVPASLTATDQGRPLYTRLGFRSVSRAVWWMPDPTGDDIGSVLR
jgi:GNAT superfamily N-acetyltransferase